ncbi:lipoprotein [Bordetella genomosp. 7]|uniref:FixH family protein n=1 Tax=Bordetella TaxID=517 RepID=UPI00047CB3BD|nr:MULTISPECIES: FixH family protein [Bordetella]OZI22252.1 lipoprotein [Bordetella genomosp. 7]
MTTSSSPKPWYREPWPWFLMAGPLLAMVGCIITIYLAVTRFDGQAIVEGAVKRGLVVERAVPAVVDGSRPAAQP